MLEKKKIRFLFTLADNGLFYNELEHHKDKDKFMSALHSEIDISKWFFFGERCMGFNQWALLNNFPRGTTHPLDEAHQKAVKCILPTAKEYNANLDKESLDQVQTRKSLQEETQRVEKERSIHIQIKWYLKK